MNTAFLDCFSGVSGDMLLGALLDAGLPFDDLKDALSSLPVEGYRLRWAREERHRIYGVRFEVQVDPHGPREHRGLREVQAVVEGSDLSAAVKEKSLHVFRRLAEVEGGIHGVPPEKVHFHEVGAVDSIVDIVGAVYGLERLEIGALHVSELPLGSGFVKAAHGTIPIPAPATAALLRGVPVYEAGVRAEMVTPTGAALVTCLGRSFGTMPPMVVDRVGYGVGRRRLEDRPNLLRIFVGSGRAGEGTETVLILETNVDDASPELLGHLMTRLMDRGALDVTFLPATMKKNRPGVQIQVVAHPDLRESLMKILFEESGTLGVRFRLCMRKTLKRAVSEVESPWGPLRVKKIEQPDGTVILAPEYEACKEKAECYGRPLREIYAWVTAQNRKA